MPERTPRYSDAERAQIAQNRKAYKANAMYGHGFGSQGLAYQKDRGMSFLREMDQRKQGFFMPTYDQKIGPDGRLYIKAKANQQGRIDAGMGDWQAAPDWAQRRSAKARAFFSAPENQGKGFDDYLAQRGLQRHLASGAQQIDPATGLAVNQGGEAWNPQTGAFVENSPYLTGGAANPWNAAYAGPKAGGTGGALAGAQAIRNGALQPGGGGAPGGPPSSGYMNGSSGGVPGAPGSAPGGAAPGGMPGPEAGLQQGLESLLRDQGPFSPAVVQALRTKAKQDAYGQVPGQLRAINENAVARGIYSSGIPADQERMVREGAAQQFSGAAADIGVQAAIQNYQGRLSALDRAQKWLDSKRSWLLSSEQNSISRELGLRQIGLAQARLQQEMQLSQQQMAQQQFQFNQLNPNLNFTDPTTGGQVSLPPGYLRYLDYFTGG